MTRRTSHERRDHGQLIQSLSHPSRQHVGRDARRLLRRELFAPSHGVVQAVTRA